MDDLDGVILSSFHAAYLPSTRRPCPAPPHESASSHSLSPL
jgi:hypothetical protein